MKDNLFGQIAQYVLNERESQSQYLPYNMNCVVDWTLPIVTVSESNSVEHWHKKAVRHTLQKKWIWAEWQSKKPPVILPCHIKMTRIASRKLDKEENLPMAFKWIKDQIADLITPGLAAGRADDNKLMSWEYDQVKGKPKEKAIRIQIFC